MLILHIALICYWSEALTFSLAPMFIFCFLLLIKTNLFLNLFYIHCHIHELCSTFVVEAEGIERCMDSLTGQRWSKVLFVICFGPLVESYPTSLFQQLTHQLKNLKTIIEIQPVAPRKQP